MLSVYGTNHAASNVNAAQKCNTQPSAELTAATATVSITDELDLSAGSTADDPAAVLRAGPFGSLQGGQVNLNDLQRQAQESVKSKLTALFEEHGIDQSQPIQLQTDATGQVIVTSDTPDKAEIEQFFKDDPQLRNDFVQSQSLAEFIGAAREAQAFHQAYAKNPQAAVNEFAYLFNNSDQSFLSFTIDGDDFRTVYQRLGGPAHVFVTE